MTREEKLRDKFKEKREEKREEKLREKREKFTVSGSVQGSTSSHVVYECRTVSVVVTHADVPPRVQRDCVLDVIVLIAHVGGAAIPKEVL